VGGVIWLFWAVLKFSEGVPRILLGHFHKILNIFLLKSSQSIGTLVG
jgi:hypothetical protein